jgi:hypothetical protein
MTHLRLHETPKLGVHQTGSSSNNSNFSQWQIDLAGGVFNNLGLTPAVNYGVANTVFLDTYGGTNGGVHDLQVTQNNSLF